MQTDSGKQWKYMRSYIFHLNLPHIRMWRFNMYGVTIDIPVDSHGTRPGLSDKATFLLHLQRTNKDDMLMWPWRLVREEPWLPNRRAIIPNNTSTSLATDSHLLSSPPPPPSLLIFHRFSFYFLQFLSSILYATQCANASISFGIDTMNDSTGSETLGVRKRVDSITDDQIISNLRKRPRVSSMAGPFSLNDPISIGVGVGPVNFYIRSHTHVAPFLCSD